MSVNSLPPLRDDPDLLRWKGKGDPPTLQSGVRIRRSDNLPFRAVRCTRFHPELPNRTGDPPVLLESGEKTVVAEKCGDPPICRFFLELSALPDLLYLSVSKRLSPPESPRSRLPARRRRRSAGGKVRQGAGCLERTRVYRVSWPDRTWEEPARFLTRRLASFTASSALRAKPSAFTFLQSSAS